MRRLMIVGLVMFGVLCGQAVGANANIQIDPDAGPAKLIQNETSIVLNPASPGNIVVTYNDNPVAGSTFGLGVSVSTDGGGSWAAQQLTAPGAITGPSGLLMARVFDPVSAADRAGNLFAGYIADNGVGGDSGLYVELSTDNGVSWNPVLMPVSTDIPAAPGPPPLSNDPLYRFNDKPHMVAGPAQSNTAVDHLYVTWIKDRGFNMPTPDSDIYFSWSTNQGTSWNTPAALPTINDIGTNDLCNGPNMAVASDGTLYVAWANVDVTNPQVGLSTLVIDTSTDGGITWGTDVTVQTILASPDPLTTMPGAPDAVNVRSYPSIGVSPTNSQHVYVVYASDPDGPGGGDEGDIFFTASTGGTTGPWSAPIRVNWDDTTLNDNFEPWLSVKPNGVIDIAWFDRRNDPNDANWEVYMSKSTDGGLTFSPNYLVSVPGQSFGTPNTLTNGVWMGEYLGIATDANDAYIAYTNGWSDTVSGDVWFARVANTALDQQPAVPEPAGLGLLGLGMLVLRKKRSRAFGR